MVSQLLNHLLLNILWLPVTVRRPHTFEEVDEEDRPDRQPASQTHTHTHTQKRTHAHSYIHHYRDLPPVKSDLGTRGGRGTQVRT